ncbi:efflux RND transporter periplasmic adaptor subunit [Nitrospina gracilis]|uniref:efflux RND transporter periplasmic adaptor subunit n=1 Tax=Nitrospina gracilis TaxID=35801 RepID=UPI001F00ABBE|nr:efflux RND transporter periplasmic adaptor subunit [Nitrospina gracilis]MCF8720640.1 HlyD family secretion protein [Nitrospina gracilis Nb-211]
MKKLLIILGVVVLVAGTFFLVQGDGKENKRPKKHPFRTAKVERGTMVVKISATGIVEPNFQVEVKSKASGEVLSFPYEEGDFIEKGKFLLRLDKSDEVRNVKRAEANLASAKAQLDKAKTSLKLQATRYETDLQAAKSQVEEAKANLIEARDKLRRQEDLFQKKFTSRETLDAAQTTYKVREELLEQAKTNLRAAEDSVHDIEVKKQDIELAKADVKRAELELAETRERLAETEIYAPITGVLIEKLVEQGQIIASGITTVSGGTPLAKIADMSKLFIVADVDETDIGKVEVGQKVKITTDAYPSEEFDGTVTRIAPKGLVEDSITIFKVKIEIQGKGRDILKPMMTANVDIISRELEDVTFLPREAIHREGGKTFVAVLENNLPQARPVELGVKNPIEIQVEGIAENQEVLIGDWEEIKEHFKTDEDSMSTIRKMLFILRR